MAATVVQTVSDGSGTSGSTFSHAVPAGGYSAGSVLVLGVHFRTTGVANALTGVTDTKVNSWTVERSGQTSGGGGFASATVKLAAALVLGDTIDLTWAGSVGGKVTQILEVTGLDPTTWTDLTSSTVHSGASPILMAALTPTAGERLVVAFEGDTTSTTVTSVAGGWTQAGVRKQVSGPTSNQVIYKETSYDGVTSEASGSITYAASVSGSHQGSISLIVSSSTTSSIQAVGAIASAQAFGTPQLTFALKPTALASVSALGTPQLKLIVAPVAIDGGAVGTPQLKRAVKAVTLGSQGGIGQPMVSQSTRFLFPVGVIGAGTLLDYVGTPQLKISILPAGINPYQVVYDQFIRSVAAGGLGTAELGGAYTVDSGTAANWSVSGGAGKNSCATKANDLVTLAGVNVADEDWYGTIALSALPIGSTLAIGPRLRITNSGTWYQFKALFLTTGDVNTGVDKVVNGATTAISASTTRLTGYTSAGAAIRYHAKISGTTIQFSIWFDGQSEPAAQVDITDASIKGRGSVGFRVNSVGLTNSPVISLDFFDAYGVNAAVIGEPKATLIVKPVGIATLGGVGQPALSGFPAPLTTLYPQGIAPGSTGTPQLKLAIKAVTIASAGAFGAPQLKKTIGPVGIASGSMGNPLLVFQIKGGRSADEPSLPLLFSHEISWGMGIPSEAAVSVAARVAWGIRPPGIQSASAFGQPTVIRSGLIISNPGRIASAEAFGTPFVRPMIRVPGIQSAGAFGQPTVLRGSSVIVPVGIAAGSPGTPQLTFVLPDVGGIDTGEAFGTPFVRSLVAPPGIATTGGVGTPQLTFLLKPTGISAGSPGTPQLTKIVKNVGRILPLEEFGQEDSLALIVKPVGIVSAQALGQPTVINNRVIGPVGIASTSAFGNPKLTKIVYGIGIASAGAFGTPLVLKGGRLISQAGGIASAQAFGTATLSRVVHPTGVQSLEAFGSPSLTTFIDFFPEGWEESAFGTPTLGMILYPVGIGTGEAFGFVKVAGRGRILDDVGISDMATFTVDVADRVTYTVDVNDRATIDVGISDKPGV